MALKAKKKIEEPVETTAVEENVQEENPNINEAEKEAIAEQENVSVASTEKLRLANELLAHQFNIDDTFHVTQVKDTGKSMTLGFANGDYEVTVKIKDTEEQKIFQNKYKKAENVAGAFDIDENIVSGKKVILIDDVYDSGATIREIGEMLTHKGASYITPVVIAKTVGGTL